MKRKVFILYICVGAWLLMACSTTSTVPNGDQLFVGLTKIEYVLEADTQGLQGAADTQELQGYAGTPAQQAEAKQTAAQRQHTTDVQLATVRAEIDAALATAPNGALFGSSYYRSPFPVGLWIWNKYSDKSGKVATWITKAFGRQPVLMSKVSPDLRSAVAQNVLRNHGFLNGTVNYSAVPMKNRKKAKLGYTIHPGHLYMVDTLVYVGFPQEADNLIRSAKSEALIGSGSAFDAATLDGERTRVATLLRNNGYYYYQSSYAAYLADTLATPGKAQLRLQLADGVDSAALHKWYMGRITIESRKSRMEQLPDTFKSRYLEIHYNGKPALRPRVLLREMTLRPRQLYSYSDYLETANKIGERGIFSNTEFVFTPRCDTLDLTLSCLLGDPYDAYLETNYTNKINGRTGPQLTLGLTKRNAFRGGETLDASLHGSYEWESGGNSSTSDYYEYGADLSLEFPRLVLPLHTQSVTDSRLRRRPSRPYYTTPSSYAKLSANVLNRPGYFRMNTLTAEWTYKWQRTASLRHEFSPLTLQYQTLTHTTARFDTILTDNPYLQTTMQSVFIPKIRYTLSYSGVKTQPHPIVWSATITEASNLLSLAYMACGRDWAEQDKQLLGNKYAQFVKVESDLCKTWHLSEASQLVAHAAVGAIVTYGNSSTAPYSEQFYVGGASSVRAFTVRSIGPGSYTAGNSRLSYLDQTGDLKLLFNLELRSRLFDSLYGAVFLDAGNVWALRSDDYRTGAQYRVENTFKEMALGTGVGLRYDLEFLVLRLDWGIGLHVPYDTGRTGFYNIAKFKDGQAIHFAVGYPF